MRAKTTASAAALLAATGITVAGIAGAGAASASPAVPAQTAIHFARGATSARVSGRVAANGDRRYTFSANAGQTATFHLSRSTSAMTWTLVGPTGPSVHSASSPRQSDFTYRLPESGTYYVDLTSTRAASYDLSVAIPAARSTTPASGSEITFAPGATSATVRGSGNTAYTFDARAGQTATVHFSSPGADGSWTLVAPDGSPLHSRMSEEQAVGGSVLPTTGTYRLDVAPGTRTAFTLSLSIPRR